MFDKLTDAHSVSSSLLQFPLKGDGIFEQLLLCAKKKFVFRGSAPKKMK